MNYRRQEQGDMTNKDGEDVGLIALEEVLRQARTVAQAARVEVVIVQTRSYKHPSQSTYLGLGRKQSPRRVPVPNYMDQNTTSDPIDVIDIGPTQEALDDLEAQAAGRRVIRTGKTSYTILR